MSSLIVHTALEEFGMRWPTQSRSKINSFWVASNFDLSQSSITKSSITSYVPSPLDRHGMLKIRPSTKVIRDKIHVSEMDYDDDDNNAQTEEGGLVPSRSYGFPSVQTALEKQSPSGVGI